MDSAQRIAKNSVIYLVSQVISQIFLFFSLIFMARYLEVEEFGLLAFAMALTAIFGIFADFGFQRLTIHEVSKDRSLALKYLGNIIPIKILLVTINFMIIALFLTLFGYHRQETIVVYLVALAICSRAFTELFYSIFTAFEKLELVSLGLMLRGLLFLSLTLLAIELGLDIIAFAAIQFLVALFVLGYCFMVIIAKFGRPRLEMDYKFWRNIVTAVLPFGLTLIFYMISTQTSLVVLSMLKGNKHVGWFNAAYMIISALIFIPVAFNLAVLPALSRYYGESKETWKLLGLKLFKFQMMVGIPIGVGIMLLADRFIIILFGSKYRQSTIILQILIWALVIIFARSCLGQLLTSADRQGTMAKIHGCGMPVAILLSVILISYHSAVGAAVAALTIEVILFIPVLIYSRKIGFDYSLLAISRTVWKPVLASVLMGISIVIMRKESFLLVVAAAVIIYFATLLLTRAFDREEVTILKKSFGQLRVVVFSAKNIVKSREFN